jgi:glycosyltransferase involved in cell wall biosynthesis
MDFRVSAIIATYNRSDLIGRAIESVLCQTYQSLELIVIDDGSCDNTEAVVYNYSCNSVIPIRYYYKENGGCASARNKGVDLASGDTIAFLDSDDEWLPEAIENMLTALEKSGADFVYSPSIEVLKNGEHLISYPAAAGNPSLFAVEHFFTTKARPCSILYRKHIFELHRNDESLRYNEDSDFLQRVAISFKAAYFEQPTALIYHHDSNKSSNLVEINFALLKSSENILVSYPAFRVKLGASIDKRLTNIVAELAGELILENKFDEVILLEKRYGLDIFKKLSIRYKTPHLEITVRRVRMLFRKILRCVNFFCVRVP